MSALTAGLDVLEELLGALGSRARNAIVSEGGLAPLVRRQCRLAFPRLSCVTQNSTKH